MRLAIELKIVFQDLMHTEVTKLPPHVKNLAELLAKTADEDLAKVLSGQVEDMALEILLEAGKNCSPGMTHCLFPKNKLGSPLSAKIEGPSLKKFAELLTVKISKKESSFGLTKDPVEGGTGGTGGTDERLTTLLAHSVLVLYQGLGGYI